MSQVKLNIRRLQAEDAPVIAHAFRAQGWNKPVEQYERYLREQQEGRRVVLVAFYEDAFAGYLTVLWTSAYSDFRQAAIPEITDLNTLRAFQKRGIASALLDNAEQLIAERSPVAGIGVGLTADYGPAQRLYARRGYVPDGKGISQRGRYLRYGEEVVVDDDLVLYFTKPLR